MIDMTTRTFPDGSLVKRYDIPAIRGEGGGTVLVGPDGLFAAVTDFGDYCRHWPWNEPGDFREMLCRFDEEYLLMKLSRKEYDGPATADRIRETVAEELTGDDADEELALLADHEDVCEEFDYARWHGETTLQVDSDFTCERWPGLALRFVREFFPRLREVLRAELATERWQSAVVDAFAPTTPPGTP